MNRTATRIAALALALGSMTFLQGCFPALGLATLGVGAAGTVGILQTTQTVQQVGDATTDLIRNADQQLTLTAEAVRNTLGSIDVLVQHLTTDADALTNEITSDLSQLTDELSRQLQGLGELRKEVQAAIAQGSEDLDATLANIDALIQSTQASFDAISRVLSLVAAVAGPKNATARQKPADDPELRDACADYLATRNLEAQPREENAGATASQMPRFEEAASDDRS